MTALDRYVRLESGGLWRADADAQRRDVTVSFGDATLVISDGAGRPLTHWSLPAIERQNPDERPAIFAPDEGGHETLEIKDDLMIDAIETVGKSIARARPHPGKLRHLTTATVTLAALAIAFYWLPGALTRQTLAVVPLSTRTEIGATLLGHIQRATGSVCRGPQGLAAADKLKTRLLGPDAHGQIVVVPHLPNGPLALPGGIIMLDKALVEQDDDPAIASGYIVAASAARHVQDPLESLLRRAGLRTTFRLLTTGEIPAEILEADAQTLLNTPMEEAPMQDVINAFDAAQVPKLAYAQHYAERHQGVAPFVVDDPDTDQAMPVILDDGDWVSLQNICNDQ